MVGVLLGPRPSLPALRQELTPLVRAVPGYYAAVRLLRNVHASRTAIGLCSPVYSGFPCRHSGGLPVPMHEVSRRARALRLRGAVQRLAYFAAVPVAFAVRYQLGAPDFFFHSSIPRPPVPLSTLRWLPRGAPCKTRGQDGSLFLSCETLSFSTPCRSIPAHNEANFRFIPASKRGAQLANCHSDGTNPILQIFPGFETT